MRTWLTVLLLLGVGTAGALKLWQDRAGRGLASDAAYGEEVVALVDDAAAEEPLVVDEGDDASPSEGPSIEGPAIDATSIEAGGAGNGAVSEAPAAPRSDGESDLGIADQPGGATALAEGEARRRALELVAQAARSTAPVEQARLLTDAITSGSLERAADEKAYEALLDANRRGLLHPRVFDGCMQVEVKSGDSLWLICRRLAKEGHSSVTPGLVRLMNGMPNDNIRVGTKLKVPTAPVAIVVEKSRYRLNVFIGDLLLRRYQVGLGKDNRTPEGDFKIKTRLVDPPWFKPGVGEIPAGHPENVLGTRWLGFDEKPDFPEAKTFGIHGTREDDSIGTQSSNGCVRMHNAEVEELFEWVGEGVKVVIKP